MCSSVQPEQTAVIGGAAVLSVDKILASGSEAKPAAACPYGRYHNAMISTEKSRTFTYGYFAARVRFQAGQGQHGGFWLQANAGAAPQPGLPDLNGAEIDTVEYYGDGRHDGGLSHLVHFLGKGPDGQGQLQSVGGVNAKATALLTAGDSSSKSYHVFSVEWTPTQYVFRIDGAETMRTTSGVSHHPEFLALSCRAPTGNCPR